MLYGLLNAKNRGEPPRFLAFKLYQPTFNINTIEGLKNVRREDRTL